MTPLDVMPQVMPPPPWRPSHTTLTRTVTGRGLAWGEGARGGWHGLPTVAPRNRSSDGRCKSRQATAAAAAPGAVHDV